MDLAFLAGSYKQLSTGIPRFAQALGFIGFTVATALFLLGFATAGWVVAAAVGALQGGLAATGYCLGCRLYFLKWWVPAQL